MEGRAILSFVEFTGASKDPELEGSVSDLRVYPFIALARLTAI